MNTFLEGLKCLVCYVIVKLRNGLFVHRLPVPKKKTIIPARPSQGGAKALGLWFFFALGDRELKKKTKTDFQILKGGGGPFRIVRLP